MPDDHDAGSTTPTSLETAAVELLRSPLKQFVAERKRLAGVVRDAGDHDTAAALLGLRKPSVAAWALNVLAAHRPELFDELEQLGSALGAAQQAGDAASLRSLGADRRSLVSRLVDAAVGSASDEGATLSAAVVETVRESLQAASADAELAAQVSSGRLTDAPTSSGAGWGGVAGGAGSSAARPPVADGATGVDADGATGVDADRDDLADDDDRRRRLRARLEAAERDEESATTASEAATALLDESAVRRSGLLRDREDLARRLDELDADLADADRESARRRCEADRAQRAGDAAHQEVERLRSALDD